SEGQFAEAEGFPFCTDCSPGTFADHQSATMCNVCLQGSYSEDLGSSVCELCGPSSTTFSSKSAFETDCVCGFGFYGTSPDCKVCPPMAHCAIGSTFPTFPDGYYVGITPDDVLTIVGCIPTSSCLGT